jgi:hypothetical protein
MVVTVNNEKVIIPSSWEELKTGTWIRIIRDWQPEIKDIAQKDYFELFKILTGKKWKGFLPNPKNEAKVWSCVRWVIEQPFEFSEKPDSIIIRNKLIKIPPIGSLSIGQNIYLRQKLEKVEDIRLLIAKAVAVYLQPLVDECKFDVEKAKELEDEIMLMPVCKVYPLGFFLLIRAINSGWKPLSGLNLILSNLVTRLRLTLLKWQRLTGSQGLMTYL